MGEEYKDISEVIGEAKLLKHSTSLQELNNSILSLTKLLNDMLAMFKAASEQMGLEEKDSQNIHDSIISKLDEIIEQNKTIATGMVALAELAKERPDTRLQQPPQQFHNPQPQPIWPAPPTRMAQIRQPIQGPAQGMPQIRVSPFNQQPPPIQPIQGPLDDFNSQPPDLEMPDITDINEPFPFEGEKKKKGLFGRFSK